MLDECSSVLTADAAADQRFRAQESIVAQAVHSAMAVPLFDNEQVLGLIYVDRQDLTGPFAQEQLEVLTLLANMAAVKIKNARLLEAEQAARQLAQQLETAVTIQRSLLPPRPPDLPGWQFDAYLESCYAVGGDLFDFHRMADGRLLFMIGDVSGKGLGAALVMTSFLAAARVLYGSFASVVELATRLSATLNRDTDPNRFVTGVVGCLDPATGRLDYVNAGHPAPCVVSAGGLTELDATGSSLVYSTYLGGSKAEYGFGIGVDTSGNILVCGFTTSSDFPTALPMQATPGANPPLNVDGNFLIGPTYVRAKELTVNTNVPQGTIYNFTMSSAERTDDLTLLLLRRVG